MEGRGLHARGRGEIRRIARGLWRLFGVRLGKDRSLGLLERVVEDGRRRLARLKQRKEVLDVAHLVGRQRDLRVHRRGAVARGLGLARRRGAWRIGTLRIGLRRIGLRRIGLRSRVHRRDAVGRKRHRSDGFRAASHHLRHAVRVMVGGGRSCLHLENGHPLIAELLLPVPHPRRAELHLVGDRGRAEACGVEQQHPRAAAMEGLIRLRQDFERLALVG